jgi:hypothetical protein
MADWRPAAVEQQVFALRDIELDNAVYVDAAPIPPSRPVSANSTGLSEGVDAPRTGESTQSDGT